MEDEGGGGRAGVEAKGREDDAGADDVDGGADDADGGADDVDGVDAGSWGAGGVSSSARRFSSARLDLTSPMRFFMPFMVCLASALRLRFFMEPVISSFGRSSARGGVDADAPAASSSDLGPVPGKPGGSGIRAGSLIAASRALVESEGCLRADERDSNRGGTGDAGLRAKATTRCAREGAGADRARRAARAPRTTLGGSRETNAGSRARRASLADPRAPAMERERRADRREKRRANKRSLLG